MSLRSRIASRMLRLPAPESHDVTVERDLPVPMRDGAELLADRWYAPSSVAAAPVVLLRSPYGRRQFGFFGRIFAARGYQVVIQSCRGTFDSGGEWLPFRHESDDGADTAQWITEQDWYTGSIGTFGPSYLGITQWAVAQDPHPAIKAMALHITASNVRDSVVFPGGSFSLETGAMWIQMLLVQEHPPRHLLRALAHMPRTIDSVGETLPLGDCDSAIFGRHVPYFHDWMIHEEPGDPWWEPVDFSTDVSSTPPMSLVGGWYDFFLPGQVDDYQLLRARGRPVRMTIGPWKHTSGRGGLAGVTDALDFFDEHLRDRRRSARPQSGVRLFVMGSKKWIDVPEWPPPADMRRWHLQPGRELSSDEPAGSGPDVYRYDPARPTPAITGASLYPKRSGPKDQRTRELRSDVLSYSTEVLDADVTVIGPLSCELWVRTSRPHFDLFVRLCDVDRSGTSVNIADGIRRVNPPDAEPDDDGISRFTVDMWPTAHTFLAGHRIRLQVSSGAHPLFARNLGSGEPLRTGTTLSPVLVEIFYGPERPSAITLPVSALLH